MSEQNKQEGSDQRKDRRQGSLRTAPRQKQIAYLENKAAAMLNILEDLEAERNKAAENQAYLASVLNTTPTGIIVMVDRIIQNVNDEFCKLYGYSRKELIGQDIRMVYPTEQEYHDIGEVIYSDIREKGKGSVETRMRTKDGNIRDILVNGMPVDPDDWSKGLTFAILDITERKNAEQQLKDSKAYMESIISSAPTGIAVLKDRVIQSANQQFCDILGYTEAEVLGQSIRIIYPDDAAFEEAGRVIYEQIREDGVSNYEAHFVHKDGRRGYGLVRGTPIDPDDWSKGITFTLLDITDRKKAEEELKMAGQQYRQIFNTTIDSLFVHDAETGEILDVNETMLKMYGYSRQEALALSVGDLSSGEPPYTQAEAVEHIRRAVEEGTQQFTWHSKKKNGDCFWAEVSLNCARIGGQNRVLAVTRDITNRKRAEEALSKRMVALTQPLDDTSELVFEDMFDLDEIQRLQDKFAQSTGVASIITNPDGEPITNPSNFCRLCSQIIRKSEVGLPRCMKSDAALGCMKLDGPVIQPCLSGGLWDAGASIAVGGKHIANWLIGQVRDATQTEEQMRVYAREIGVDEQVYIDAFKEVPQMSREQFDKVAQTLFELANQLSTTAYQNIQQARFISERKEAENALSQRLKLEHLLSDISSGFIGLPTEQTFEQINRSLQIVAEDLGFERIRMLQLTEDESRIYMSDAYFFGVDEPFTFESDDFDRDLPEYANMLREKNIIWLSDLPDDLPEDSTIRQFCIDQGIISHLSVPMTVGQQHIGVLNVTHKKTRIHFDQDLLNYLQLIAEVLANAIVRYRNQQALAESEQRFRSVIESSPMGIMVYELDENDRLVLTGTNRAAGEILKVDNFAHVGQTLEEAYPKLAGTEVSDAYHRIAKEGGMYHGNNFEYHDEHIGGYYEFDAFQTSPGKIAVMFMDVTERIENQRALQFTQFATDHAGEAVFWINHEGRFIYVNELACKVLGYPRDELLTMSVPDIDPDMSADAWPAHWQHMRQTRFDRFQMHHKTKAGSMFPVEIASNFLEYEGHEYICAFTQDITERKRYENAIDDFLQMVASKTGTQMFEEFARQLAIQLTADMTVIGRITGDDPDMIETLAVYRDGHVIENFSYFLAGTPCEQAIHNQLGMCVHSDNVAEAFPDDTFLDKFDIRAYIGMPLVSQTGRPMGILCSLYRAPKQPTAFEEAILKVYGNQAVMELQRLQAQAELEALLSQLKSRNIELDQVSAMLQTSLEQSPAGILIADAPDVNIRFANPAALMVRGQTDDALTDISYEEHTKNWHTYYPDGRAYPPEELPLSRAVLKGEVTKNEEVTIIQEDGEQRWISANAAPILGKDGNIEAGIVVFYDITDQKVIQQAMMESENKHRLLFTSANDAILIMDQFHFLECNPRALELYGCETSDQILGKSPVDFSPQFQEDGQLSANKAKAVLQGAMEGNPQRFSWIHKRLDGELFYAEVALNKLHLGGRDLIQAVVRDVTERRVAEKAQEKLLRELSSKNEELESIVYIASHDLRSPLVNIRGFSAELEKSLQQMQELLSDAALSDGTKKQLAHLFETDIPESLHFINNGNQKLDTLLNGLLRLSRIGAAEVTVKRTDMNKLFESVLANFHFKIHEGLAAITVEPDLPACLVDKMLISQVFINLVDNAIKYHHPDRMAEIHISAQLQGKKVIYCVADNGMGIAEDHVAKIFEIFHRLHPTGDQSGEGLGLTIVRRILDRQEGSIRIESKVDVGTRMFVELPKG
ncbi:MAG: PAS domain S-box protein [Planctomycetota bacterium]|jgi:PAS domain S-box-containing protein